MDLTLNGGRTMESLIDLLTPLNSSWRAAWWAICRRVDLRDLCCLAIYLSLAIWF